MANKGKIIMGSIALKWIFVFVFMTAPMPVLAASTVKKSDVEKFYKPVTQRDLIVRLQPQKDNAGMLGGGGSFFTGSGACPDQINIGSITEDTTIVGSANINVDIQGDIIVQCGGGF